MMKSLNSRIALLTPRQNTMMPNQMKSARLSLFVRDTKPDRIELTNANAIARIASAMLSIIVFLP